MTWINTLHTTDYQLNPFQGSYSHYSHFVRFGLSPEKREKVLNISTRCARDCESFRKNVVSSAEAVENKQCSNITLPFISGIF